MPEKEAKKILNGLARKAGARRLCTDPLSAVTLEFKKHTGRIVYSVQKNGSYLMEVNELSCRRLLEKMLQESAKGRKYFYCCSPLDSDWKTFLPAYSTLESVLISLDLEGLEGEKRNA